MKDIRARIGVAGHGPESDFYVVRITSQRARSRHAGRREVLMYASDVYLTNLAHAVRLDLDESFDEQVTKYEAENGWKAWFWCKEDDL